MKKIYITLGFLFVGMMAMAYFYFSNLNTETNANDLSLNAASTDAAIVFSFENDKSFYEILSGQDLLQDVLGTEKSKQLKTLKDSLLSQSAVFKAIEGQKIYIGMLADGAAGINYIISTQLPANIHPQKLLANLAFEKKQRQSNIPVFEIKIGDSTTLFLGISDQLVLISNAEVPILNALKQTQATEKPFPAYIKANSRFNKNTLANLYLNFNQFPPFLKNVLASGLTGELSIFNKQDAYAALSYNFSAEKLLFNGHTLLNGNTNYYALFSSLPAQAITIDHILPAQTANYTIYTIKDYLSWQKALHQWMKNNKEDQKIENQITQINSTYRLNLQQIIPKYFKDQFSTFQLNSGEKFAAIALTNGEKVNQLITDLSNEYAPGISILKEPHILYAFFGLPFKKFEKPFYTIIDNYLILSNNASSIQVFLNAYQSNKLLVNDADYITFKNQLSFSSTLLFYVNNSNSTEIFSRNLKNPFFKQYRANQGFKNYNAFCYQLTGENGKFLTNMLLLKKSNKNPILDTLVNSRN